MGPFVPDFITDEMNLVVALFLGIAFGYVLEQAGFSSSRRLAGVFYGYDFTVLRVFFTAAITAMLGIILLGFFGWLDTDIIYVNPTFLGPAIVGGAIMGVGFVIGGYCPGTSVCAAAIGKKDALAFVFGGLLGVFLFGEFFSLYDGFFESGAFGPLKVFDSLGLSSGMFVFVLILFAVLAFALTTRIERKVNPENGTQRWPVRKHVASGGFVLLLGAVMIVLPGRKQSLLNEVASASYAKEHPLHLMTDDELAFRILDKDPRLVIIDVRDPEEYKKLALPGSVNVGLDGLFGKEYASVLGMRHKERVFVDDDGTTAKTAALLATRLGYDDIRVLEGGLTGLQANILRFKAPEGVPDPDLVDTYRFRERASTQLAKMIEENKNAANKPKAPMKKIQGGC
ncbi:MAG: rhodanese-like domain-containing protein [Bacteroidota bacterium]